MGMSHPPNGTVLAPRARWRASSGEVCRVTARTLVTSATPAGVSVAAVGGPADPAGGSRGRRRALNFRGAILPVGGEQLDDGGVDLLLHAVESQQVEYPLALVAVDHVDELVVLAHQYGAVAGDHQLGRGHVLAQLVTQVAEALADRLQLDAVVEQGLDQLELEQV